MNRKIENVFEKCDNNCCLSVAEMNIFTTSEQIKRKKCNGFMKVFLLLFCSRQVVQYLYKYIIIVIR